MDTSTSSSSFHMDTTNQSYLHQQQLHNPHIANHGYYYASPHQLYPFMSIFYSNVQQQRHLNQQQLQPQDATTSMNKYWTERNQQQPSPQSLSNVVSDAQNAMDSGYWNLPKPQYGALASKRECKVKSSRIGDEYQAVIPPLNPESTKMDQSAKSTKSDAADPETSIFEDHCVWESHKVPRRQLDEYLNVVQFVMGSVPLFSTQCPDDQ